MIVGRNEGYFEETEMVGMIARWGHNALLIALGLMTYVVFFTLK